MLNTRKFIAVCTAALGIAAGATALLPATAAAAAPYGGQCGAGFNVVDKHELRAGTIFLTYNGRTNCVVTVRDHAGAAIPMGAAVRQTKDHSAVVINDGHKFTDFAFAKVEAQGRCIDWGGFIDNDLWQQFNVHCGR